ncbi:MAG: sigma factor-like helix-turn-helix DNA-binding protein, partial [Candidatus Cryptobacteroides sp.]
RKKIFKMSRFEDKTYQEIAEALDISPKTVQYHISCALAELRKLM